ncbi:MAG TPA: IS1595 family transposase [Bryobacteraceae bacterium]|nr:IS1595 family transposase [Bryobacteraceae bacterium]
MGTVPSTLQEAVIYFADAENCQAFMANLRWPDGKILCPRCGSANVKWLPNAKLFKCYQKHEKQKFSLKVGTVFEDSPIGLEKWLPVVWLISNCKNGISSYEIHRAIGVTQKTAWFMLHRARVAMMGDAGNKLAGEIEADETLIGGNVRNMHRLSKRAIRAKNEGNWGRTPVLGLLEREGRVRAAVAPNRRKHHVQPNIIANVEPGSTLYTDEFNAYDNLPAEFKREVVNHLQQYVNGRVHTNGMENFWSLLKRTLKGTYVSVDPCHLQAYVDEQVFRYNHRKHEGGEKQTDFDRFKTVLSRIVDKRLTYAELIGKEAETWTIVEEGA